jgi:hypothetical protein
MKTQKWEEDGIWASFLTLKFGTTSMAEFSTMPSGSLLPPKKFLGSHFSYTPSILHGLLNMYRSARLLENF